MTDTKTSRLSLRLADDLRRRLERVAEQERRTLTNVIEIALEDWLNARTKRVSK
jgi:predicted transcriptional regulator